MANSRGLFLALFLCTLTTAAQLPAPPATPKRPVIDQYYDVKVRDDYRWLEDWDGPEVKQWSAAQNARTREYLDRLPTRAAIKKQLRGMIEFSTVSYFDLEYRGQTLFAEKAEPPKQQPLLVALSAAADPATERVVFDPNAASAKGSIAMDFYVASRDGKYVAIAISENGSEDSTAHVFEAATGKELSDRVPRVNFATAGGSIAWNGEGSGFYYTRYPQGNERPLEDANFYQQIYFHRLGDDAKQDTYVLGKDFPRIAEILLDLSEDGRWTIATVANGDGGQYAHYRMDSAGHWTQITHFEDEVVSVKVAPDGSLVLLSNKNAPRGKILRMPAEHPDLATAKVIVPESSGTGADEAARASIESFMLASDHLYVTDVIGGPSRVRVFDLDGHPLAAPALPAVSAVSQIVPVGSGNVLMRVSTYLQRAAWYKVETATGKSTRTALYHPLSYNFDDAEAVRAFTVSKDGTHVPMTILRRKGTPIGGTSPAILTGYGGYGVNEQPNFAGAGARFWLDQGGIFVFTNIRGGAEYGQEWHKAGNLTHKQNVFDDFAACAQYLIEHKYTSPSHLAIIGGSNGGLLMGAELAQHPELFRAVVSYVGIYDMLRVELDPNGAFNTTEFGTVKNRDQFDALYAYSPYHHVKDGTAYPAVLFLTGENDHRVNPMNSRKMTARLQAATRSGHPILLRTSSNAGHGIGTALDEQIEQQADVYSFLLDQMGIALHGGGGEK